MKKGTNKKIKSKTVPYMVSLEVESLGSIDLYFLYTFDNIPKKIKIILIY
jgi:hypothetical protein